MVVCPEGVVYAKGHLHESSTAELDLIESANRHASRRGILKTTSAPVTKTPALDMSQRLAMRNTRISMMSANNAIAAIITTRI